MTKSIMKFVNYAAWIASEGAELEVATAPFPTEPGDEEIVIKNRAVAVNPVDWKIQASGSRFGLRYPYILGEDVAGEVIQVGSKVKHLKKGDRVIAHALGIGAGNPEYGGFQLYPKLKAATVAPVPDHVALESAVVLPLSISTAAAGLYLKDTLGLQVPKAPHAADSPLLSSSPSTTVGLDSSKPTLLLWGGSSSVGSSVVQLALASGYNIVATASPANYAYVKSLGAALVLDYHNPDIVPILVQVLQGSGTKLVGAYDAIGTEATVRQCAAVVGALGGGKVASVGAAPEDAGTDVKVARIGSTNIVTSEPEVARKVWGEYVPAALGLGTLLPRPKELVIGRGLYYLQGGLDTSKAGVSAAKVVVTL